MVLSKNLCWKFKWKEVILSLPFCEIQTCSRHNASISWHTLGSDLSNSNLQDSKKPNWQPPHRHWVWWSYLFIPFSTWIHMDMQLMESIRGKWLEVGSVTKGTDLYFAKRESDNISSFFVCYKNKIVPFIMPDLGRRWDGVHSI